MIRLRGNQARLEKAKRIARDEHIEQRIEQIKNGVPLASGRGIHKRPQFQSPEHATWFSLVTKRELYELLKDVTMASQFDSAESDEARNGWLTDAKDRQRILKANGII